MMKYKDISTIEEFYVSTDRSRLLIITKNKEGKILNKEFKKIEVINDENLDNLFKNP